MDRGALKKLRRLAYSRLAGKKGKREGHRAGHETVSWSCSLLKCPDSPLFPVVCFCFFFVTLVQHWFGQKVRLGVISYGKTQRNFLASPIVGITHCGLRALRVQTADVPRMRGCCVAQSCPSLRGPTDGSPPGSSVRGTPRQERCSGLPFPSPNV